MSATVDARTKGRWNPLCCSITYIHAMLSSYCSQGKGKGTPHPTAAPTEPPCDPLCNTIHVYFHPEDYSYADYENKIVFETLISRLKILVCGLMLITLVLINLKSCSKCNFRNCEPFGNFMLCFDGVIP